MTLHVAIAVRGGPSVKSRLRQVLSPTERVALVRTMLTRMLDAVERYDPHAAVFVVTPDPQIVEGRAEIIPQASADGLNAAFTLAIRRLMPHATAGLILLPGDLPLIQSGDIAALQSALDGGRAALAPALRDLGTCAVALPPEAAFTPAFGRVSFLAHRLQFFRRKQPAAVILRDGLNFDLDTPADLRRYHRLLSRSGGTPTN